MTKEQQAQALLDDCLTLGQGLASIRTQPLSNIGLGFASAAVCFLVQTLGKEKAAMIFYELADNIATKGHP